MTEIGWAVLRPVTTGAENLMVSASGGVDIHSTIGVKIPQGVSMMTCTWTGSAALTIQIRDQSHTAFRYVYIPSGTRGTQRSATFEIAAEVPDFRVTFHANSGQEDVASARLGVRVIPTF